VSPALLDLRANLAVTVLPDQLAPSDRPVLQALPAARIRAWRPKASPAPSAPLVRKDLRDRLDQQDPRARKVWQDIRVLKALKAFRGLEESPAPPVPQDLPGPLEP
jgi:hypothetical protein